MGLKVTLLFIHTAHMFLYGPDGQWAGVQPGGFLPHEGGKGGRRRAGQSLCGPLMYRVSLCPHLDLRVPDIKSRMRELRDDMTGRWALKPDRPGSNPTSGRVPLGRWLARSAIAKGSSVSCAFAQLLGDEGMSCVCDPVDAEPRCPDGPLPQASLAQYQAPHPDPPMQGLKPET